MQAENILYADFLDILFDGRNKQYGAYELRSSYNKRIITALICMTSVCLSVCLTTLVFNKHERRQESISITEVALKNITKHEEKPAPLPPARRSKPASNKPGVSKNAVPVISRDVAVQSQPVTNELQQTQLGFVALQSAGDPLPPGGISGNSTDKLEKAEKIENKEMIKIEREARFPGGMQAWKNYLERRLDAGTAADNGAPAGDYTVKVQFLVDSSGAISRVQAIEVPAVCAPCGAEAVKVIEKGPKWEPAIQNGRKVDYRAVQSITFRVTE